MPCDQRHCKNRCWYFHIARTQEEATNLATYLHINPDKLSDTQMNKIVKGVRILPVALSQPKERMLDADINMARFQKVNY